MLPLTLTLSRKRERGPEKTALSSSPLPFTGEGCQGLLAKASVAAAGEGIYKRGIND
jgi:hypothetical protein